MGRRGVLILALVIPLIGLACSGDGPPSATVEVDLTEWAVRPSVSEVKTGSIRFVAHNRSAAMVHELAVLSVAADGQRRPVKEIEDIEAGKSGETVAGLKPGEYELACLIAPGEAGSSVDHYQQGMRTAFTVR